MAATITLATDLADLVLRPLAQSQALELHDLLQQNREHLTAHGDYIDQVAMSYEELKAELAAGEHRNLRFGLVLKGELIGCRR